MGPAAVARATPKAVEEAARSGLAATATQTLAVAMAAMAAHS
jgi:hypothetical protein